MDRRPSDRRRLVVFGSSRSQENDPAWQAAHEVGRVAAARGLIVISGGYAGTMGAVSGAARQEGGHVVGITTRAFTGRGVNADVAEHREEADYPGRLAELLRAGDAFVALPGGLGTCSELLTAWCLASIDQLGGPLWAFADPWRPLCEQLVAFPEVAAESGSLVRWLESAEEMGGELDRWLAGDL